MTFFDKFANWLFAPNDTYRDLRLPPKHEHVPPVSSYDERQKQYESRQSEQYGNDTDAERDI